MLIMLLINDLFNNIIGIESGIGGVLVKFFDRVVVSN